mmetsp:Transcript_5100/g.12531  ORF Transcript_5100/g.12531 Transcript_5100/m.12531 type:complete len:212 (-) Transcript_5100:1074-1709(-)
MLHHAIPCGTPQPRRPLRTSAKVPPTVVAAPRFAFAAPRAGPRPRTGLPGSCSYGTRAVPGPSALGRAASQLLMLSAHSRSGTNAAGALPRDPLPPSRWAGGRPAKEGSTVPVRSRSWTNRSPSDSSSSRSRSTSVRPRKTPAGAATPRPRQRDWNLCWQPGKVSLPAALSWRGRVPPRTGPVPSWTSTRRTTSWFPMSRFSGSGPGTWSA